MKVILIKNVNGLGKMGETKEVKEGYARNFLLPNNLAKLATKKTVKELENDRIQREKAAQKQSLKFKEMARKLNNFKLIIKAKADDKKKLFGSVSASKIAQELKERNFEIEPKYIKLEEPIKSLGYHEVALDFGGGVSAKLGLTVAREE
ncbi:MAG: 50S ribosomal protein L9 [Patescibacteria group bacterium]|nr:50S ribosomal protein L9 [Patescibacteria group bacterium]